MIPSPLATIWTDERYIEGQEIGIDQQADTAWVKGEGKLVQLVEPGMFNQQGFDDEKKARGDRLVLNVDNKGKPQEKLPKVPFTVKWSEEMKFFGQSKDPRAVSFFGRVRSRL